MTINLLYSICAALLGWLAGIAVNALADWLPGSSSEPALKCIDCHTNYTLRNYFFWPRRCPTCGKYRNRRTWFVELFYIIATIWMWYNPPSSINFFLGLVTLIYLGIVFVIDIEHKIIHTYLLFVGVILGFITGFMRNDLVLTLLGGVMGLMLVALIYLLGFVFTKLMVKWRKANLSGSALGFGDVLLSGVLGLMVGWPDVFLSLFIAVLSAGLFSGIYIIYMVLRKQYTPGTAIPYAPFLIIGAVSVLYF